MGNSAQMAESSLSLQDFGVIRKLVQEQSGIQLTEQKWALVNSRVSKRLKALGLGSFPAYMSYLDRGKNQEELVHLLNAISTNVTHFFREPGHFEWMQRLLSEWSQKGQKNFTFWSAACSSGEEPYSMAMVAMETLNMNNAGFRILATDISTDILGKGFEGYYKRDKMSNIPEPLLKKYFSPARGGEGYQVRESLKKTVSFSRLNLIAPPLPMKGPFDLVFCRNVMIYFANDERRKILKEIERLLKPGGYLFVGHAESLAGQLCDLEHIRPSIYRKGLDV